MVNRQVAAQKILTIGWETQVPDKTRNGQVGTGSARLQENAVALDFIPRGFGFLTNSLLRSEYVKTHCFLIYFLFKNISERIS